MELCEAGIRSHGSRLPSDPYLLIASLQFLVASQAEAFLLGSRARLGYSSFYLTFNAPHFCYADILILLVDEPLRRPWVFSFLEFVRELEIQD